MDNAFVEWAQRYITHIDERLPWLESRRITMGEMRDGTRVDTTQDLVDDLRRQKDELLALIVSHEAHRA
jgi:hypothetical protein